MDAITNITLKVHYGNAQAHFCQESHALVGYFLTEENEEFQVGLDWNNQLFTYARFQQEYIGMEDARLLVELIENYNPEIKQTLEQFDFQFDEEFYTI